MSTTRFIVDLPNGKKVNVETHDFPHLDELTSILLIEKYGTPEFVAKYAEDGVIKIGVGHGSLDEHQENGSRRNGECAATLTAKALGINAPEISYFLDYVLERDTNAGAHPLELEPLVKMLVRQNPGRLDITLSFVSDVFETVVMEQQAFLNLTREEFEKDSQLFDAIGPNNPIKLALINSDNPQVNKYARWKNGGGCNVVIQYQPEKSHVQIFANTSAGIDLTETAAILRYEEQASAGKIFIRDWQALRSRGNASIEEDSEIKRLDQWYLVGPGVLLNGSLSAPNVPPTALAIERILELVKIGINPQSFEPSRQSQCSNDGFCSATKKSPCPWRVWGLRRCRRIRAAMHEAA